MFIKCSVLYLTITLNFKTLRYLTKKKISLANLSYEIKASIINTLIYIPYFISSETILKSYLFW